MTEVETASVDFSDGIRAAEMAAHAINEAGGVGGRPLEIVSCDSKADPGQAAVCASQLLNDDEVLLMLGAFSLMQSALYPQLDSNGAVFLGNVISTPDDQANPNSYPFGSGAYAFANLALLLPEGSTKVAFVMSDSPGAKATYALLGTSMPDGVELVAAEYTLGTTDFQPICLKVKESGAQSIITSAQWQVTEQLIRQCSQIGVELPLLTGPTSLSASVISLVEEIGIETTVSVIFDGPRYDLYHEQLAQDVGGFGITDQTDLPFYAWAAVYSAADVLRAIGTDDPSRADIKSYLDAQTDFETGATPPLDFTRQIVAESPRLFNTHSYHGVIENGAVVIVDPNPISVVEQPA